MMGVMEQFDGPRKTIKWRDFLAECRRLGVPKDEAWQAFSVTDRGVHYRNETYHAMVLKNEPHGLGEGVEVWWLSIKRHDREPVCDWRAIQQIKNDICGKEAEGFMLYPAESRCVDTANQYHLFVVMTPGYRIPVGWTKGMKCDSVTIGASKQRSFGP